MTTTIRDARRIEKAMRESLTWHRLIWGEVDKYVLPRKLSRNGDDGIKIIDSTTTRALQVLARGMMSGLTSSAKPWFRLNLSEQYGPETEPERNWLNVVESRIYAGLARSNFYPVIQNAYTELAAFGSTNIYQELDERRLMRFTNVPCGDFAWARNDERRVDTVVHYRTMTARQIVERYGEEKLSTRTRRLLRKSPEERVDIVHMVRPRKDKIRRVDAFDPAEMPWESLVWEADDPDSFLHEGGYEELPHITAHWHSMGAEEPYGCSPVMEILPTVQRLHHLSRKQLLLAHKAVHPTKTAPKETTSWFGSIVAGGLGCILSRQRNRGDNIELYQMDPDMAAIAREIEDLRSTIRKDLFNDFFLAFMREAQPKTKQEMEARSEEVLTKLSPVIERLQVELLDPLIERTYGIIKRSGMLPTPPCCMEGKTLRIEYISPLAEARRELVAKELHTFFMDIQKTFRGGD